MVRAPSSAKLWLSLSAEPHEDEEISPPYQYDAQGGAIAVSIPPMAATPPVLARGYATALFAIAGIPLQPTTPRSPVLLHRGAGGHYAAPPQPPFAPLAIPVAK